MVSTLKERQIESLKQMLNMNSPITKSSLNEPTWKILIYDRYGQDILSPLLTVRELREMGVTLHVQLHSDRDPVPDVPAIYFCMPSEENLDRIGQDLGNGVYDSYSLNFISPISRQRLEELAITTLHSNCVSQIQKVFDQYCNFITLEDNFFILRHQNSDAISYYAINHGGVKDTEMELIMDGIVDSLFSVFVTLGTVPVIRSSKDDAAEMIARKLDKKLRENVRDTRNSLFNDPTTGQFSFQRPILILLDRNMDMTTPLIHSWTYQALAHDVLDLTLNRVILEEDAGKSASGGARSKTISCELNQTDAFWMAQKGSPFPMVAEAIQEELEKYRTSEDEVKRLKISMGLDKENESSMNMFSDSTAMLTSAVSSLPQLLETKRLIDLHTTIATAILNHIKLRKLDLFFELEEKIMTKVAALDKSVMELLSDTKCGAAEDKMRMFLVYYMFSNMSERELDQYASLLKDADCNLSALTYIKRWKTYTKMESTPSQYSGGGTKTINMFSKLMSQGSSFVMEGVKNFVVKKHSLPVTKVVDELMEQRSTTTDVFRYFDPKLVRVTDNTHIPRAKGPYQDAIVFMVGGGNYVEYQNLIDDCKSRTNSSNQRRVIYGCSTLHSPKQFLKQLCLLGEEIQ